MRAKKIGYPVADSKASNLASHDVTGMIKGRTDLTLDDIPDFDMRLQVAKLLAVAPALPVRDLYRLLIDSKGHLAVATQKAIRASEAPTLRGFKGPSPSRLGASAAIDADGDELMVKIDPYDPSFEWDTDEPANEPANKSKPTYKPIKSTTKSSKEYGSTFSSFKTPKSGRIEGSRQTGLATKPKKTMHNSVRPEESCSDTREFVSDEPILSDSDDTFQTDSDDSGETTSSESDAGLIDSDSEGEMTLSDSDDSEDTMEESADDEDDDLSISMQTSAYKVHVIRMRDR